MPAVTLKHSTTHSSQNCGVRIALRAETFAVVISVPVLALRRVPSGGPPVRRGHADEQPAHRHEHRVDQAHDQECLRDAVDVGIGAGSTERGEQLVGQRRRDQRAAAEAHDRDTGRQAGTVREPLDQRGDRRDVADAQPDPADEAVPDDDQPVLPQVEPERGDQEAADEARRRHDHRPPRPVRVDPRAEQRGRQAEHDDPEGERQRARDAGDAQALLQRRLEHAPRVGLTDGQVDRQRGRRHEPPAPPRRRDDPLTLQEPRHVALRDVDHPTERRFTPMRAPSTTRDTRGVRRGRRPCRSRTGVR